VGEPPSCSLDDLKSLNLNPWVKAGGSLPPPEAVVFIDNHDKQRGHGGGGTYLTHKNGDLYALANVFMLAFPYGKLELMSSYRF
jgi:alpha-amylase